MCDLIKPKNFCTAEEKNQLSGEEAYRMGRESFLAIDMTKIHIQKLKGFKNQRARKTNDIIKPWAIDLNRIFSNEETKKD